LHTLKIHFPYGASEKLKTLIIENQGRVGNISEEEVIYLREKYDEKIKEADEEIRRIVKKLREMKIYDNSIIIITSDHGECFGEHGFLVHGHTPYEELIHVPLIIKFPYNKYGGKNYEQIVRHVDIVPTILDILNLKNKSEFQGISLIPIIEGKNITLDAYSWSKEAISLREKSYKYILYPESGKEELYDLEKDPKEQINLVYQNISLCRNLRNKLLSFINNLPKTRTEKSGVYEKSVKQLRELGYIK
jgi:arylsulfatase A-like enzyme